VSRLGDDVEIAPGFPGSLAHPGNAPVTGGSGSLRACRHTKTIVPHPQDEFFGGVLQGNLKALRRGVFERVQDCLATDPECRSLQLRSQAASRA